MAGSKSKFVYASDPDSEGNSILKVVELDESNLRAIGFAPINQATLDGLPDKRVQPLNGSERYITLTGQTAVGITVTRKICVPSVENTFFQAGGSVSLPVLGGANNLTLETVVFTVTNAVGEKRSFTRVGDTGLTDGTPTE